jgi:hypothetical protein
MAVFYRGSQQTIEVTSSCFLQALDWGCDGKGTFLYIVLAVQLCLVQCNTVHSAQILSSVTATLGASKSWVLGCSDYLKLLRTSTTATIQQRADTRLATAWLMANLHALRGALGTTNHGYPPLHRAREKLHLSQARVLLGRRRAERPDDARLSVSSSSAPASAGPSEKPWSPSGVLAVVTINASDIYRQDTLGRGCGILGVGVAVVAAATVRLGK